VASSVTDLLTPTEEDAPPEPPRGDGPRMTRRALLGAGLSGAVALAGAGYGIDRLIAGGGDATDPGGLPGPRSLPANGTAQRFVSRPDLEPTVTGTTVRGAAAPGLFMVGPGSSPPVQAGPMIVDGRGELVWFAPLPLHTWLTNLQVRSYRGRPVLTWWEGKLVDGYGVGEAVIADTAYREIARVKALNGRTMDLHEFQLTPSGTALFTCTPRTATVNLSSIGGPPSAHALESIFQEVDISTGRLIREWRSLDHVPLAESYRTTYAPFDYLHVNSIDVLADGDLLVSARNTWALYKLDRSSGEVVWRLGGKRTDFAMAPGAQFAWQHDARQVANGRMTLFDDGFDGVTRSHTASRGLILGVDEPGRKVGVQRAYTHPAGLLSSGMGNAQLLDDGHMVVGFGDDPYTTEFAPDGSVVSQLIMPKGQHSYRSFRLPWHAVPAGAPAVASRRSRRSGKATLYVSWNGATGVARWRVLGGARRSDLRPVATVGRDGFETRIELGTGAGFVRAQALDAAGRELGRSAIVRV
jgi:hypothetical protein